MEVRPGRGRAHRATVGPRSPLRPTARGLWQWRLGHRAPRTLITEGTVRFTAPLMPVSPGHPRARRPIPGPLWRVRRTGPSCWRQQETGGYLGRFMFRATQARRGPGQVRPVITGPPWLRQPMARDCSRRGGVRVVRVAFTHRATLERLGRRWQRQEEIGRQLLVPLTVTAWRGPRIVGFGLSRLLDTGHWPTRRANRGLPWPPRQRGPNSSRCLAEGIRFALLPTLEPPGLQPLCKMTAGLRSPLRPMALSWSRQVRLRKIPMLATA